VKIEKNKILLGDCMDLMAEMPDNYIDLAIVDPPYGIFNSFGNKFGYKDNTYKTSEMIEKWDFVPDEIYFDELFRISKNQIIWGMQYFNKWLPTFSQLIVWDKKTGKSPRADGECAYCSIKGTTRIYKQLWSGAFIEDEKREKRIHPTQKPIKLYRWILQNYAKPGLSQVQHREI